MMKRTRKKVVMMWAEIGYSAWPRTIIGMLLVLSGAFATYGKNTVQYWNLEEDSGATATNAVAGGNDGALINFDGDGWTNDTPAALAYSTGALDFISASNQYVNGGHIGISSLKLNKGATVSVWLKPRSLIFDMRLWGQLRQLRQSPHPIGAIALRNDNYSGWTLKGFHTPSNSWKPVMPAALFHTNLWQHFCFVWRESQLVTYLNGNPVGGMDNAFEFDRDSQNRTMDFGIGARYLNSYGKTYDGKMDDLAVWNENLTAEQVRQLASGVSPLSIALRSDLKSPPKPLAEYRLDDNAQDACGIYHGTVNGSAVFTNGVGNTPFNYEGNSALWLDGGTGNVTMADTVALRPGTKAWTLSLWFKTSTTNQLSGLITKRKETSPHIQMSLMLGGTATGVMGKGQRIHTFVIGAQSSYDRWEVSSNREYTDGQWHHLALVRTTDDWSPILYIDGVATAITPNLDSGIRPHDVNCIAPWRIGDDGAGNYFEGLIDEVAMWDTALTGEQIAWLARNSLAELQPVMPEKPLAEYRMDGNARDTRGRHNGSLKGDAFFVKGIGEIPFSYAGNSALKLDGDGDSLSIPDHVELRPGTSAWTLSLWFKTSNASQYGGLITKRQSLSPYTQMALMMGGSASGDPGDGQKIHPFLIGAQTSVDRWEVASRQGYADDEWHHLALVRPLGNTSPVLYVDGAVIPVDVLFDAGTRPHDVNCSDPWRIGTEGGNYFEGLIDEVAMWDAALSSAQIAWLAANSLSSIPRSGTMLMIQ